MGVGRMPTWRRGLRHGRAVHSSQGQIEPFQPLDTTQQTGGINEKAAPGGRGFSSRNSCEQCRGWRVLPLIGKRPAFEDFIDRQYFRTQRGGKGAIRKSGSTPALEPTLSTAIRSDPESVGSYLTVEAIVVTP